MAAEEIGRVRLTRPVTSDPQYHWLTQKLEIMAFTANGELYVYSAICPHMGAQLQYNCQKQELHCPWHPLKADIKTGRTGHKRYARVQRLPAQIDGDDLVVSR